MNRLIFMGRLTADITDDDVRYTAGENATCITHFRIAVDRRFTKRNDENAPKADFFQITAFGRTAEFAKDYLKKGTKVVIEGRLENNNYKDKDGKTVYKDQIIAENIEFAESKKAAEDNGNSVPTPAEANVDNFINEGLEDSLPFK